MQKLYLVGESWLMHSHPKPHWTERFSSHYDTENYAVSGFNILDIAVRLFSTDFERNSKLIISLPTIYRISRLGLKWVHKVMEQKKMDEVSLQVLHNNLRNEMLVEALDTDDNKYNFLRDQLNVIFGFVDAKRDYFDNIVVFTWANDTYHISKEMGYPIEYFPPITSIETLDQSKEKKGDLHPSTGGGKFLFEQLLGKL